MLIHKLSSTRVVSHVVNAYSTPIFGGSSLNRKFKAIAEANEKSAQARRNVTLVREEGYDENSYVNCGIQEDTAADVIERISKRRVLSDAAKKRPRTRTLSTRSKYKIRDKIETFYRAVPSSKFTFLTLTFIAQVDDRTAQKVFNKFLTVCRKSFGTFSYIWVAERQQDTKNVHFHLITNRRWDIPKFNALWVVQQYNAGIMHEKYSMQDVWDRVADDSLQEILNPFDVKRINGIRSLSLYLTKYVTKNTDEFGCALWHCSRDVSALFTSEVIPQRTFVEAQQLQINFAVNTLTGEVYEPVTYVTNYAVVVNILNKPYFARKLSALDILNRMLMDGLKMTEIPSVDFVEYQYEWNKYSAPSRFVYQDMCKLKPAQKN